MKELLNYMRQYYLKDYARLNTVRNVFFKFVVTRVGGLFKMKVIAFIRVRTDCSL